MQFGSPDGQAFPQAPQLFWSYSMSVQPNEHMVYATEWHGPTSSWITASSSTTSGTAASVAASGAASGDASTAGESSTTSGADVGPPHPTAKHTTSPQLRMHVTYALVAHSATEHLKYA
jgi:hypothetical protein